MFDLGRLEARYRALVKDTVNDKRAPDLMSAVLRHGNLPRGEAHFVLKTSERTARNTLKDLVDCGFLKSDTPKTPVRIGFPLDYRERLFPNLLLRPRWRCRKRRICHSGKVVVLGLSDLIRCSRPG
jgi:hypothetical protein